MVNFLEVAMRNEGFARGQSMYGTWEDCIKWLSSTARDCEKWFWSLEYRQQNAIESFLEEGVIDLRKPYGTWIVLFGTRALHTDGAWVELTLTQAAEAFDYASSQKDMMAAYVAHTYNITPNRRMSAEFHMALEGLKSRITVAEDSTEGVNP